MLVYGDIVLIDRLLDPNGLNPKMRPAVVISPDDEIAAGLPILIVAISTLVPDPLPRDHVLLPWSRPKHPRTGLNRRCAAICSWVELIDQSRIIRQIGVVPSAQLEMIATIFEGPNA